MSFRDYLLHGWKLCAIPPGSKGPQGAAAAGWNRRDKAISDPGRGPALAGAGLCHAWSGTCALDIDRYDLSLKFLAERGIDLDALLLDPRSVQITSGREGRAKLIYALPSPLASSHFAPYQAPSPKTGKPQTYHAFELRCATADGLTVQDVLPPSIHPLTGREYAWQYGNDLVGHWSTLSELPAALHALWTAALSPPSPAALVPTGPVAPVGAVFSEIEELLESQDPDGDYPGWIKVGMMLHHETQGSAAGFDLWNAWSAKGAKYKGRADLDPHWRSFRSNTANAVTLGSLRGDAIAKLDDFPLVVTAVAPSGEPDIGIDTRPREVIRQILETRLVFVAGQDRYYDLAAKADAWLSDRSVRHLFCPLMPYVRTPGKDGQPDRVVRPDPVDHLKNSKTKTVVDVVGLHPGEKRLFTEDDRRYINRYTPRVVEPLAPKPHELEAFEFLWGRMLEPIFQQWLLKFYAHALQKPGIKIQSAPLLFSAATGTGKNTIAKMVPSLLFGTQWVRTMSGNVLNSQFNDAIGETWWLYLEELRAGSTKVDRVQTANKIKAWVTDDTIEVHPKGLKPYDIRNRIQITATSNFDDALQIDNNDRRWAVCELGESLSEREALDLFAVLNSDRAPGVLRHIFQRVNLTGFQPASRAPITKGRTVMISAGLGSWESLLIEMMTAQDEPFNRDIFTLKAVHERLLNRGPTNLHQLRNVLKRHPFNCQPLNKTQTVRLWSWRNHALWKHFAEGDRRKYIDTGVRPTGREWSDEIPATLSLMSVESDPDSDARESCRDLL